MCNSLNYLSLICRKDIFIKPENKANITIKVFLNFNSIIPVLEVFQFFFSVGFYVIENIERGSVLSISLQVNIFSTNVSFLEFFNYQFSILHNF